MSLGAETYHSIVVVASPCQLSEIFAGFWSMLDVQFNCDGADGGLQLDLWSRAE